MPERVRVVHGDPMKPRTQQHTYVEELMRGAEQVKRAGAPALGYVRHVETCPKDVGSTTEHDVLGTQHLGDKVPALGNPQAMQQRRNTTQSERHKHKRSCAFVLRLGVLGLRHNVKRNGTPEGHMR